MGEEKVQVKVFKTASRVCEFANGVAGKIRITPAGGLETGCAEGWLPILEWQTAGKKRMNTGDWLRGFHGKTEHLRWD
jgi:methionyl-tRNA formyltransferase